MHVAAVIVSSTWRDLQLERRAVQRVLSRVRETKYLGMENFGSRPDSTEGASIAEVERANLYVGIIGVRYGSGITEKEYRAARRRGIDCLIYLQNPAAASAQQWNESDDDVARLERFRLELRREHLVAREFSTPDELAADVATDVHRWLFDTFLAGPLERAAAGTMDQGEADALLANIKDETSLPYDLKRRLRSATRRQADDAEFAPWLRSVTLNVSQYPALRDFVYDFGPFIDEVTRDFVARSEVVDAMSEFASAHPCGYFRVVADAGLGKTALAAEVAGRYGAPAFFCSASEGRTRPEQCLRHLCADVIMRFGLDQTHLPARAGDDPALLRELLRKAVEKAGGPIWIVVDGIDEGDDPPRGRNPLGLPEQLPSGVFFYISHREVSYPLMTKAVTRRWDLRADAPEQRRAVDAFVRAKLSRADVQRQLERQGGAFDRDVWANALLRVAAGNFKYLEYVFEDLMQGTGSVGLESLPAGLTAYYEQMWGRMGLEYGEGQSWSEWTEVLRPVAALLAVAAEPVSVAWLAAQSGLDADVVLHRALARWRRFLVCSQQPPRWRVMHKSFSDFLQTKSELAIGDWHRRVAARCRAADGDGHEGYSRRHLTLHLRHAGELGQLMELLRQPAWHERQLAADPSGALFSSDVEHAWACAAGANQRALAAGKPLDSLSDEIECALFASSVRSISGNLPGELLLRLVNDGRWTMAQALAAVRQIPDASQRVNTLLLLIPALSDRALLLEALELSRNASVWNAVRGTAPVLQRLAHLGFSADALEEARKEKRVEGRVLAELLPRLAAPERSWARERLLALAADGVRSRDRRVISPDPPGQRLLLALVDDLEPGELERGLDRIRQSVDAEYDLGAVLVAAARRFVQFERPDRAEALLPELRSHERIQVLSALSASATENDRRRWLARALVNWRASLDLGGEVAAQVLALSVALGDRRRVCRQRSILARIRRRRSDGTALAAATPVLGPELLDAVNEVARSSSAEARRRVLLPLAKRWLELGEVSRAVEAAASAGDSHDTGEVRAELALQAARQGDSALALSLVDAIQRDYLVPSALERLVPLLDRDGVARALEKAASLHDKKDRRRVRYALGARLAVVSSAEAALQQVQHLEDDDAFDRARGALCQALARHGAPDDAWQLAPSIHATFVRAGVCREIAQMARDEAVAAIGQHLIETYDEARRNGPAVSELDPLVAVVQRWIAIDPLAAGRALRSLRDAEARTVLRCNVVAKASEALRDRYQVRAVRSLLNGWSFDYLLPRLLESLGPPACFGVLHALLDDRRTDWQAGTKAIPVLGRLARIGFLLEAEDSVPRLGRASERVEALLQLARATSEHESTRLVQRAIEEAETLDCFAKIAAHLDEQQLAEATSAVLQHAPYASRAEALAALFLRRTAFEPASDVIDSALRLPREEQAIVLARLVDTADPATAVRLVERAPRGDDARAWRRVIAGAALRLARLGDIDRALSIAFSKQGDEAVVAAVAPFLSLEQLASVIEAKGLFHGGEARDAIATRFLELGMFTTAYEIVVSHSSRHDYGLALIVAHMENASPEAKYALWSRALRDAAARDRREALADLAALMPLTARLGGVAELGHAARALTTVARRWP